MRNAANHTLLVRFAVFAALLATVGCGDDDRTDRDVARFDGGGRDTEMPDTSTEMCEIGLVDCGEGCTALAGDSANCGACGVVCPSGFSCAVGRCDCAEPSKSCDGLCTDPSTDNDNCGDCGNVCREGDVCLEGTCVVDCEAPDQRCPGAAEGEFVCSDPQTDALNCGVCGGACSAGAVCVGGGCSCAEGQISCSGACVDPMNDATHCGDCLTNCGVDGVCMGGACSTCGEGLTACGAVARCTDTDTSRLHCGACDNTCGPGAGCTTGVCSCLPGFTDCDGECAALPSDRDHCGACGVECGPLGACSAGACICAPEATMCGPECAVLDIDPDHCGACDNACESGEICRGSTCLLLNATCAAATPITGDTTIVGEDIAEGGARSTGTGCGFGSGAKALYYAVTVPAGQRATATATSSTDLVLFVQGACADAGCTNYSDFPERVTVDNVAGTSDRTFYVGVRGYSSGTGTFDIAFTFVTPVVAANASCATATPITAATTIAGEDITEGGARATGTNCGFGTGATALYYAVTVPAGQRARLVADSSSDLVVFSQAACSDTGCLIASDFPEEATVDNALGTAAKTEYVGVRGYGSSTIGTFDVTVTYTTPVVAANASCATATAVTETTTFTAQATDIGGARPSATSCGGGGGWKTLYYAATIPAGDQVVVTTSPSGDIILFELPMCGAAACVASTDSSPETLTYTNTTGAPVTHIFGVRPYGGTATPTFGITFTYSTP